MQALDKIRPHFEPDGCRLGIITPDRCEELYALMKNDVIPDEPVSQLTRIEWTEESEERTLQNLKQNMSLCILNKETDEIMGVRLARIIRRTDPAFHQSLIKDEKRLAMYRFLTKKDDEIDLFNRLEVAEVIHFFGLGVARKFRKRGIATLLLNASIALVRELGFQGIKGEATSYYVQKIYERAGFELVATIPYITFVSPSGETNIDRSQQCPEDACKIYILKLSPIKH